MVRWYTHLAPHHLTEYAHQIDTILNDDVPNMSDDENIEVKINW